MHTEFQNLIKQVKSCKICKNSLPRGIRPVFQVHSESRILIAGQAPGRKVHDSGIPFDDASGERLRDWMAISKDTFYDAMSIAVLPIGMCYPGAGKSGDLPPRKECAPAWRKLLLSQIKNLQLTLVIGQYAMAYHLPNTKGSLTSIVKSWKTFMPDIIPLPHPSPRNNIWLKKNPWFQEELIPALRLRIKESLKE